MFIKHWLLLLDNANKVSTATVVLGPSLMNPAEEMETLSLAAAPAGNEVPLGLWLWFSFKIRNPTRWQRKLYWPSFFYEKKNWLSAHYCAGSPTPSMDYQKAAEKETILEQITITLDLVSTKRKATFLSFVNICLLGFPDAALLLPRPLAPRATCLSSIASLKGF